MNEEKAAKWSERLSKQDGGPSVQELGQAYLDLMGREKEARATLERLEREVEEAQQNLMKAMHASEFRNLKVGPYIFQVFPESEQSLVMFKLDAADRI